MTDHRTLPPACDANPVATRGRRGIVGAMSIAWSRAHPAVAWSSRVRLLRPAVVMAFVSSCGGDLLDPVGQAVQSIVISPPTSTVAVGASLGLTAQVLDPSGTMLIDRPVHWSSENLEIATITADGVVQARKLGTVQVAASAGGRSGFAEVTVTATPVATVHVSPANRSLYVEESFQFTAEARDGAGNALADRPITWSSNNPGIATVSASGLVTALSPGGAIITASAEGKSAPASVTVSAVPVASVQVKPSSQSLVVGQAAQLEAQPLDASGSPLVGRVVLWSTSDASVASVTSTGVVTAVAPGTATITATCEGRDGTSLVSVASRPPNAVVVTPAQALVLEGATTPLSAQVLDPQGSVIPGAPIAWASSDDALATVSSSGVVTGVGAGKVTITASSGGKSGTSQVTVLPIPVGSVVITPPAPFVTVGRTVALTAEALSATGAPLPGRNITWSTSTPGVAQVSATGMVTGVSPGTAVIFASADGVLGWVTVRVGVIPVSSVTVTPATPTLTIGETISLSAALADAAGAPLSGRVVSWSSDATSIAAVSTGGTVTGLATGTATITATSEGQTGTATVTVAAAGVRTLAIVPDSVTLGLLGTVTLAAVVRDPAGVVLNGAAVAWSSSNALVAGVSAGGTVTGLLPGIATITATSGSASSTATVVVKLGG